MEKYREFRILLRTVDLYYEDFEHGIISYIELPGNSYKKKMIEDFIINNPSANASDVTEYMINETDFYESCAEYRNSLKIKDSMAV